MNRPSTEAASFQRFCPKGHTLLRSTVPRSSTVSFQRLPPVRSLASLFAVVLVSAACTSSPQHPSAPSVRQADTLSRHGDGTPKVVTISRGDSVLERRTYRSTGTLLQVVAGDSVRTYFDLHDPDSAAILQDYLQGRWRNLSAEASDETASVFYAFTPDDLTFENAAHDTLESLGVTYEDDRTLTTENGMSVEPEIASFDTVRVTGFTLVREASPDSSR